MSCRQTLTVLTLCGFVFLSPDAAETATVQQVLDGDTCRLSDSREIRYLGIDAPEKGDPFANEATQINNRLVGGRSVRCEIGPTARDRNGRILAYVFQESTFVNAELLRQGAAYVRRPVKKKYREILNRAQDEARMARLGIWRGNTNAHIVIAAVHAKPKGGRENLSDEYPVLKNLDESNIDMTGWTVSDEAHQRYLVPHFVLPAKATVTLRTGLGKNDSTNLYWGSRNSIWNDNGDTIFSRDDQGRLVLSHVY